MSNEKSPFKETAISNFKLKLIGQKQDNSPKPPTLNVSVVFNNPRLSVFTNIPGDNDHGGITAPMDPLIFTALMDQLLVVADGPSDTQLSIENMTGPPSDLKLHSTTIIGKDKKGRVYISVVAKDRPKIKFLFLPSQWHNFINKNGERLSEEEVTVIYAKSWANTFKKLVPLEMNENYIPRDFNKDNNWNSSTSGHHNTQAKQSVNSQPKKTGYDMSTYAKDDLPL